MSGLIRKFFWKNNGDSSKTGAEKFSREMVSALMSGEYIDEFARTYHRRYSNMYKVLSRKQFVATLTNVFHEMLESIHTKENFSMQRGLVVQLIKRIIEMSNEMDVKFSQVLIASGYQSWNEIQEGNHTIYGFNEAFDELYNNIENWLWSFDSFSVLYDIGKEKMQDDPANFFSFEMQTIFSKYFDNFLQVATCDSIKFLKKLENDGFFIAGNILDEKARAGEITYEQMEAVEMVAFQYPELRPDMYNSILEDLSNSTLDEVLYVGDFYLVEDFSIRILDILNKMADYSKYQSMVFNVKECWKNIIDKIFEISNGVALNKVSDLLVEYLGVSKDELENYIEEKTWGLLMSVYGLGEIDYADIFDTATRMLANKVVYDVVTTEAFGLYDLRVW